LKRSEWNEKQLEEMLKQLPKIEDHRDPRDIYHNILYKRKAKKHMRWILPSASTVSVFFLLFLLFNGIENGSTPNESNKGKSESNVLTMNNTTTDAMDEGHLQESYTLKDTKEITNKEERSKEIKDSGWKYLAVYENDIKSSESLTYAVPDQQSE